MGFNTLILFRNDSHDVLVKHPQKVLSNISAAMSSHQKEEWSVGNDVNPMMSFPSIHSGNDELFLVSGNGLMKIGESYPSQVDLKLRKRNLEIAQKIVAREAAIIQEMEKNQK